MAAQARIVEVLEVEERGDGTSTLSIELDEIPGAVWQMELLSLLPGDVRVSLFERGGRKFALLSFPSGEVQRARAAFAQACAGANEISDQAHAIARSERLARQRSSGPPSAGE